LAFHDRHTGAFSCAIPISATAPSPPVAAAASMYGRAIVSLFSPFPKWIIGTSWSFAQRCTSAT
jgi:hypothetical protein